MRSLERNKRTLYYALYSGKTERVVDGVYTGEYVETYTDPVEMKANVSAARGNADDEVFGTNTEYSRTMVTTDMDCPIDVGSIVWFGVPTSGKHNYKVVCKADSINSISYALQEVKLSNG